MRWLWLLAAAVAAASGATPPSAPPEAASWRCPAVGGGVSCACDLPHTLRCAGGAGALRAVGAALRGLAPPRAVSLLEVSARGLPALDAPALAGVLLHGLVVSSGALRRVSARAFAGLASPLQALGLPDNRLDAVPSAALAVLPGLQRLDLSRNLLQRVDDRSLQEVPGLTFLDVSDNRLTELSADAFSGLPALRTLRLRGNRLHAVSHVRGLGELRELDLSANALAGPLGPRTLPRGLAKLQALDLSHNQLTSVRRGALAGLESLQTLSLEHNHIDVLEDEALGAAQLRRLVLAHNRIVAVSGASLARLGALVSLDLAHNFLRALTADLVAPLPALRELRLDDNDISMVAGAALQRSALLLSRLTLTDNPLNCDCSLSEFASWLRNASESGRLAAADVATAICATPPSLENGALAEVAADELVCGDELPPADDGDEGAGDEGDEAGADSPRLQLPDSEATAALRAFRYDAAADAVWLQWAVRGAGAYTCHSLVVYEERGAREVLLENVRLDCNSSQVGDPGALPLRLAGLGLQHGRAYRYCLLLLRGGGARSDELLLEWGCSDAIPLDGSSVAAVSDSPPPPELTALHADLDPDGVLTAVATLLEVPAGAPCTLTLAVYRGTARERSQRVNCSYPEASLRGLQVDGSAAGPLRLCASVDSPAPQPEQDALCVPVRLPQPQPQTQHAVGAGVVAALAAASATVILVALLYLASRLVFGRTHIASAHQYFLTGQQEDERPPHYVKLQATTKL